MHAAAYSSAYCLFKYVAKTFLKLHKSPASITYCVNAFHMIIMPCILFLVLSSSVGMTGMPALHMILCISIDFTQCLCKDEQ